MAHHVKTSPQRGRRLSRRWCLPRLRNLSAGRSVAGFGQYDAFVAERRRGDSRSAFRCCQGLDSSQTQRWRN